MKTKRVTIKDIAELAGVSKATASLVLNGRGKELRVAQETRERVLAIAREQHYQPSIHARSLRDNRSHTIGLVVPEITNYGFAVFSHELETLCREAGVTLTGAGATFPYGVDPADSNIRIAPSLPPVEELQQAIAVLCNSLKLAALEKMGL